MQGHEDRLGNWWESRSDHSRSPSPCSSHSDPPPESTRSRSFYLTWILLLVFFFIGMVLAVIYYLSSPNAPQFTIQSVNGINFQASCPWSIGFSIENSDKLVKFSYRKITVLVSDATTNVVLSSVEIPPFSLQSKSEIFVVAENNAATAVGNVKSSDEKTTEHQWTGLEPVDPNLLGLGFTVKVHCDVWAAPPVLPIFSKRVVDVECREVLMPMNLPRVCSSSLSNLW